jgi:hypothetical protein
MVIIQQIHYKDRIYNALIKFKIINYKIRMIKISKN